MRRTRWLLALALLAMSAIATGSFTSDLDEAVARVGEDITLEQHLSIRDWLQTNLDATILKTCSHDKLRVVDEKGPWGFDVERGGGPRLLTYRMYKCKGCKVQVLIQQAVEIPETKCTKRHFQEINSWGYWLEATHLCE